MKELTGDAKIWFMKGTEKMVEVAVEAGFYPKSWEELFLLMSRKFEEEKAAYGKGYEEDWMKTQYEAVKYMRLVDGEPVFDEEYHRIWRRFDRKWKRRVMPVPPADRGAPYRPGSAAGG